MTIADIKQAIAFHQQSLKILQNGTETLERWEHLGALAALENQLNEQLVAEVERSFSSTAPVTLSYKSL